MGYHGIILHILYSYQGLRTINNMIMCRTNIICMGGIARGNYKLAKHKGSYVCLDETRGNDL